MGGAGKEGRGSAESRGAAMGRSSARLLSPIPALSGSAAGCERHQRGHPAGDPGCHAAGAAGAVGAAPSRAPLRCRALPTAAGAAAAPAPEGGGRGASWGGKGGGGGGPRGLRVRLCPAQGELLHEELFVAVEMLSAVALVNRALDAGNPEELWAALLSPALGLSGVEEENARR